MSRPRPIRRTVQTRHVRIGSPAPRQAAASCGSCDSSTSLRGPAAAYSTRTRAKLSLAYLPRNGWRPSRLADETSCFASPPRDGFAMSSVDCVIPASAALRGRLSPMATLWTIDRAPVVPSQVTVTTDDANLRGSVRRQPLRDTGHNVGGERGGRQARIAAFNAREVELFASLTTPDFIWYPSMGAIEGQAFEGRPGIDRSSAPWRTPGRPFRSTPASSAPSLTPWSCSDDYNGLGKGSGVPVDSSLGMVFDLHGGAISCIRGFLDHAETLRAAGLGD